MAENVTVADRHRSAGIAAVVVGTGVGLSAVADPGAATPATLLVVAATGRFRGISGLVGWLLAGAVLGGLVGFAVVAATPLSLSSQGGVGLGIALGGGLGVVSNLLVTRDEADTDLEPESVTVDMEGEEDRSPRPPDLFDDHPDPVVYVADEGHGPVVRAANGAFEETFGVSSSALSDAPLAEALFTETDADPIVDAVASGDAVDRTVTCETAAGDEAFRVRTASSRTDGYVLFTPAAK